MSVKSWTLGLRIRGLMDGGRTLGSHNSSAPLVPILSWVVVASHGVHDTGKVVVMSGEMRRVNASSHSLVANVK